MGPKLMGAARIAAGVAIDALLAVAAVTLADAHTAVVILALGVVLAAGLLFTKGWRLVGIGMIGGAVVGFVFIVVGYAVSGGGE